MKRPKFGKTMLALALTAIMLAACSKDDGPEQSPEPENKVPVANAGPDQKVEIGSTVNLNAADSNDPDGDELTYSWSLKTKPSGSTAKITGSTAFQATFPLDRAGVYEIELTVADGEDEAIDLIEVTNKAPVINKIDRFLSFPGFTKGKILQKDSEFEIEGAYFSQDVSEMKVMLNGKECQIELIDDNELEVELPDDVSAGELALFVGEEKVVYQEMVYVRTHPFNEFQDLPMFDKEEDINSTVNHELGIVFKPLKNGTLLGFSITTGTPENVRYTLWDLEGQSVIVAAREDDEYAEAFENPVSLQAGKEYVFSFNYHRWDVIESTTVDDIFPQAVSNEIEVTGLAFKIGENENQEFPDEIIRGGSSYRALNATDIHFTADIENQ